MPPHIATVVFAFVILGLFWLDREREAKLSAALWIPTVWVFLAASRSVAQWMSLGQPVDLQNLTEQVMEGSPTDRLVYTGLLVIGLAVLVGRGRRVGRIVRSNGPILLFFLYCALSLLWSDFPGIAFKRLTKALGDLVMMLVVLSEIDSYAAVKRLLARAGFVLVPISVLFIKYYPEFGKAYGQWDYKAVYTGVTGNKNTLGVICLFFGLASVWRLLAAYKEPKGATRKRVLIAHGIVLAMVLWLLWMANSMTSLMCFLMASGFLLVTNSALVRRKPGSVHILVLALLCISASVLFLGAMPGMLETIGRDPTLTDRTLIWSTILPLVKNPILGTGFESFWLGPRLAEIWAKFPWQPFEAHNGYIEIFLNLGWSGIALLAVVIGAGYRTVVAAFRRNSMMHSVLLSFFVVGLVYNFTEAALFRMMAPAWIFLLLAMVRVPELPGSKTPALQNSVPQQNGSEWQETRAEYMPTK